MIPHFENLKNSYKTFTTGSLGARLMADVLSMLSMTIEEDTERQCLNYQLFGSKEQVGSFGHPYVRYVSPTYWTHCKGFGCIPADIFVHNYQ